MTSRLFRAFAFAFPLALVAPPVAAHPRLLKSTPAADSRVPTPPTELSLTFQEPITVALSRLTLLDAGERPVALDTLRAAPEDPKTLVARIVRTLAPGRYSVKWQATGADGHPMRATFTFVIVAPASGASGR